MSIFRTNNPLEYGELDGIIVDESAPVGGVQGVGTGVAILVGQFQRGPATMERLSGISAFHKLYGKSSFSGNKQLKNKRFSVLKVIRVIASGAVKALKTIDDGDSTDIVTFTAKYFGDYGNLIKVTIEAGSVSGKKYTIQDDNEDSVLPAEVYDNVAITGLAAAMASSSLVDVTVLATTAEPELTAITPLASGDDGTIADTDYQAAIAVAEAEGSGNILFLDEYNAIRNGYLKAHAATTQDKMVICAGAENETVSTIESAIVDLRDTDGRIIYADNWIKTLIDGVYEYVSPASFLASIMSQTSPQIDPAFAGNTEFLYGVAGIRSERTRDDYKRLMAAGVSSFELDTDIGYKVKSGVVTQIANSSKLTILRRRMADYLTASIAKYLKNFQNGVNSATQRNAAKGAILDFVSTQEAAGILPKDSEVNGGLAKLVDVETLNDDDAIAAGYNYIIYKQRIFSSMRFIVLQAEIGESVVVVEGE